jgi:hypothetical protein
MNRLGWYLGIAGWLVAATFAALLALPGLALHGQIAVGDVLKIQMVAPDQSFSDDFKVSPEGTVFLGPSYGSVEVIDLVPEEARKAVSRHLEGFVPTPTVSLRFAKSTPRRWLDRPFLAYGWTAASVLALLLTISMFHAAGAPGQNRRLFQFGLGTLMWFMVIAAIATMAFNENRQRVRINAAADDAMMPMPDPQTAPDPQILSEPTDPE